MPMKHCYDSRIFKRTTSTGHPIYLEWAVSCDNCGDGGAPIGPMGEDPGDAATDALAKGYKRIFLRATAPAMWLCKKCACGKK